MDKLLADFIARLNIAVYLELLNGVAGCYAALETQLLLYQQRWRQWAALKEAGKRLIC